QVGRGVPDLVLRTGKVVPIGHDQVRELADLNSPFLAFLVREPGHVFRPQPQRCLAVETVAPRRDAKTADGHAGHEPGQRDPGIVGRDAGGISAGGYFDALVDDLLHRRRRLRRAKSVALDEIFALISHAVLYGDAAAKRSDAV